MRTYDNAGWRYMGDHINLMRSGDYCNPLQNPEAWVNIKMTAESALNFFKSRETSETKEAS